MSIRLSIGNIISCLFGVAAFAAGVLNLIWGNDHAFGAFIMLASLVFFPPVTTFIKDQTGIFIPGVLKIVLALMIVWAVMGVGEFFAKLELMRMSF